MTDILDQKILDVHLSVDAASAHLWKEMNSPVNKTPYADYAEFKAKDPIGEDEFAAAMERSLRAAMGQQTSIKKAFKAEIMDRVEEIIDRKDDAWAALIIGWGIAKGMSIKDAKMMVAYLTQETS